MNKYTVITEQTIQRIYKDVDADNIDEAAKKCENIDKFETNRGIVFVKSVKCLFI
jgi:hypothetical protein